MSLPGNRAMAMAAGAIAVVVLIAVIGLAVLAGGGGTRTITAEFTQAPGLYAGNHVEVLGIPVGTIEKIQPTPDYVRVTMSVNDNVKIPARADAVLMAPEVVADRFIQLDPAYTGGPTMAGGAVIPVSRTATPQSVDVIINTLNNLAYQLGPNGANRHGALTNLVQALANQLRGNGPLIHSTVANFAAALHSVAQYSPQVASLLENLSSLTNALATNSGTYQSFSADLAAVSSLLANDRSDIGSAMANLQSAMGNLNAFIDQNSASLGSSLNNLKVFSSTLQSEQQYLAKTFDLAPLALQNLDAAIDKNAPGGPAVRTRYDPVASTNQLFSTICGNPTLRFLVVLASGTETNPITQATPVDGVCAVGNALTALTPPPGASPGPDLSLSALTGAS
jgi:phospholipid/cholesterol/gamma-HCH transport system substrate-binding protein